MAAMNTLSMASNLLVGPNYSYVFDFERDFEHTEAKAWMVANWRTVCFYAAGLYLVVVFAGQQIMASRPRFEMRGVLSCWNLFLALFSIMGACRTIPEFLYVLSTHGIYHSVCIPRYKTI